MLRGCKRYVVDGHLADSLIVAARSPALLDVTAQIARAVNRSVTHSLRPGLMQKYGWSSESEARRKCDVHEDYQDLLNDKSIQGVIIALPLHLHCRVAIEAMEKGKHVLTEKLMAHNIAQCKIMGEAADKLDKLLATGHQRHYSILYDNAVHLIRWGLLGQIHHIRAQWHRGNLPGRDSWAAPIPGGQLSLGDDKKTVDIIKDQLDKLKATKNKSSIVQKKIDQWTAWDADKGVKAEAFGYEDLQLGGRTRTALEELVRWRLWDRTGGGLMAELGSHQLDAASIFISALNADKDGKSKKVHPLTVHAVGGRHIFPRDRDADDHVYCMFEFPGPEYDPAFDFGFRDPVMNYPDGGLDGYEEDANKKIIVSYSSINGNGYGGYGEVVMGTKGTLVLEREKEVMLYKTSTSPSTRVGVKTDGGPALDTQESGGGEVAKAAEPKNVSRGYAEEIEHWAWCISNPAPENQPRCNPMVALADANLALTAKQAIKNANKGKGGFIKFEEEWFDINSDATPDGSEKKKELERLKKSL